MVVSEGGAQDMIKPLMIDKGPSKDPAEVSLWFPCRKIPNLAHGLDDDDDGQVRIFTPM